MVPIPTAAAITSEAPILIVPELTAVTVTLVITPTTVDGDPVVVWAIEIKLPGTIPVVSATDIIVVDAAATAFIKVVDTSG